MDEYLEQEYEDKVSGTYSSDTQDPEFDIDYADQVCPECESEEVVECQKGCLEQAKQSERWKRLESSYVYKCECCGYTWD